VVLSQAKNEDPTKKIGAVKNRHSHMNKVVWFKGYKGWMRYPMNNYILSHCGILSRLNLEFTSAPSPQLPLILLPVIDGDYSRFLSLHKTSGVWA